MNFQEGYVYHINDGYFTKVQDEKLMQNKENGTCRPTFLCMEDRQNPGLLWVVPMSTRVEKFQAIYDKQQSKYGKCLTIVIGKFDGRKAAFLLQNMFPITEKYLDHIHTKNGNPVPVKHSIAQKVRTNLQQLRHLIYRGKKVVFPDVNRLENLMLAELQHEKKKIVAAHEQGDSSDPPARNPADLNKMSMKDRMAAAQKESQKRAESRQSLDKVKKHEHVMR